MSNNSIYERQNDPFILALLTAQRAFYKSGKRLLYPALLLGVAGTIFFAVFTSISSSELINTLSAFFALLVFAVNSALENRSGHSSEYAAKIQQSIDIRLFALAESCNELSMSEQNELYAKYKDSDFDPVRNWYSDYSNLDFLKQVFYCQQENVRWDKNLRDKYKTMCGAIAVIIIFALILYSILCEVSVAHFFAIFSWLFPLEQFFITQYIKISGDIALLTEIFAEQKSIEPHMEEYLKGGVLLCRLCQLQNRIYERRKKSVLIPDAFYKFFLPEMQKHEEAIAQKTSIDHETKSTLHDSQD